MKRRNWTAAVLVACGSVAPAAQQGVAAGTVVVTLTGTCSLLVVGGTDVTRQCNRTIINTAYPTGRSSFMFTYAGDMVVSFFGEDSAAIGDQATLQVEEIGVARGKADGTANRVAHAVRGACTYTNPYKGPSRIICNAAGKDGTYRAEFLSDGKPPEVLEL